MEPTQERCAPTPKQARLARYWASLAGPDGRVDRSAFDPGALCDLLQHISIVELLSCGTLRFRLAGSAIRNRLGCDPVGRSPAELGTLPDGPFRTSVNRAVGESRCVSGFSGAGGGKAHAWLRAPLREGHRVLVLCLDEIVPALPALRPRASLQGGASLHVQAGPPPTSPSAPTDVLSTAFAA